MLDAGTDHVVVADAAGNVLGLLAASDLLGLESRSPFALRHAVLRAHDEDELVKAAAQLRPLLLALLDAGLGSPEEVIHPAQLGPAIGTVHDGVTGDRTMDLDGTGVAFWTMQDRVSFSRTHERIRE
jgi:hypothetical protein